MRKTFGAILLLIGLAMLYEFAVWGAVHAGVTAKNAGGMLPFTSLGVNFPFDAVAFAGALWGIGLGGWLLGREADPGYRPMAQAFLVNSLLLLTSVFAAFAGARLQGNSRPVAVFATMALLQIATGLLLCILAVFERPRGMGGLAVGGALYVACTAVTLIVFLGG